MNTECLDCNGVLEWTEELSLGFSRTRDRLPIYDTRVEYDIPCYNNKEFRQSMEDPYNFDIELVEYTNDCQID